METFTALKDFVDNPDYHRQRQDALRELDFRTIDQPIFDLIKDLNKISCCFTLQSCCGHFLHDRQQDPENIEVLPISRSIKDVDYRIAYIALCLENSDYGRELFDELSQLPVIDPEYIQFGCAEWFWEKQVNSYTLQVEPERLKMWDRVTVGYQEALHIEKIRDKFFEEMRRIVLVGAKQPRKSQNESMKKGMDND